MSYRGSERRVFSTTRVGHKRYPQFCGARIQSNCSWISMKGMHNISTLEREHIEQLSGGRIASVVEIDGEPVRLIASARRKKTISAAMHEGMVELSVPLLMRDEDIVVQARSLIAKVKSRRQAAERFPPESELYARALHLARVWLGGEVHPSSVVWSERQSRTWGTCTPTTGRIRVSTMLHGMPQWVVDSVIIHELAHLKYADHGQEFQDFTRRYPRMAEADAYLLGVAFAQRRGQDEPFPDAFD